MSTRVLIVDDHAVVRAGLTLLIDAADDLEAVGEAGSARDALFEARTVKPDVVSLDVMMPEQGGIEIVPQLLHEHAEAKVLILSMQDDPRYVREAFEAGASGYVLKEAADTELVAAIREVAGGGATSTRSSVRGLSGRDSRAPARRGRSTLRPGARGPAAARAWPHEPGDRKGAVHLGTYCRDAPGAHHAEAAALEPRRARALRARGGPARIVLRMTTGRPRAARVAVRRRIPSTPGSGDLRSTASCARS